MQKIINITQQKHLDGELNKDTRSPYIEKICISYRILNAHDLSIVLHVVRDSMGGL